jgi:hypothetical protein
MSKMKKNADIIDQKTNIFLSFLLTEANHKDVNAKKDTEKKASKPARSMLSGNLCSDAPALFAIINKTDGDNEVKSLFDNIFIHPIS